ncbi:3-oxoacyl-[acyl-carrier-protein] reductase [Desulfobacula phenolica]|uniref:3-oxoacyl-[acyl-carrier-protein] reductase n=1 Tax=Desulfobacula phenolica TaxID=90732 RepID=A0A1H2FK58_9BACT|nr:3-oxoacyl-[acyl-carrier-protein] reductase [Desulfobacula phenolica]SDU07743.1 3-oxoacyl-[acyl-carrier-protein] reductase [Desulfobacula phenolica]
MTDIKTDNEQIALVTGASGGIGKSIAQALARTGRFVYLNFHSNREKAAETLEEIIRNGGNGALLEFDVTSQEESEQAIEKIIKEKGKIDILVNNAGIRNDMLMVRMKKENWQTVLDTNLTSFFNVTRLAVKNMLSKRFGRIINISSTSGQTGQAGQVNYSASKAGLIGATKALAREIAKRNITVNAVAPGFIETEMIDGLPVKEIAETIPAGRLGKPEEVAAAVVFLCSKDAGYITGQVIGINGGVL